MNLLKSLEREYLQTLRPLTDDKTYQHAEKRYQSLYADSELLLSALEQHRDGFDNQLRRTLLSNRQSLVLSSNVTTQIQWQASQHGLKRFAHFLNALLREHLSPEKILALSATRVPAEGRDHYAFGHETPRERHIIVLYKGHAWQLQISDDKGRPATPAQLENTLYDLTRNTRERADLPFTLPCYLPRMAQLDLLNKLRYPNLRLTHQLVQALFSVSLDDEHLGDPEDALFNASFGEGGQYVCVKALCYHANLSDNHYYAHSETSLQTTAQVAEHLCAAQAHHDAADYPRRNNLPDKLPHQRLFWQFDPETLELLHEQYAHYERQAERLISSPYHMFLSDDERKRFHQHNPHALLHLLLHYAQLRTYKTLRSTYTIQFHEQHAISQETVSHAAAKLAEALISQERPQSALLRDYLAEYERRYQLSAVGSSAHQQLSALAYFLQPNVPEFFQDSSWSILHTHPFITISHHSDAVKQLCFAPSSTDGFGIGYGFKRNTISLLITHPRYKSAEVERFTREIQAGLKRLLSTLLLTP